MLGIRHGLRQSLEFGLEENAFNIPADGERADAQPICKAIRRKPLGHQFQLLDLSASQLLYRG